MHVRHAHLVVIGDGLLDVLDRNLTVLNRQQIAQRVLRQRQVDLAAVEARKRQDALQRPLQFAHVRAYVFGHEKRDLLVDSHAGRRRFGKQDRDAHLEFGRLERDRQSPAEARDQPFFEAFDCLRILVAGDHDLLVRFDQRIEEVKELFLRAILAAEELDVVDQQQVQRSIVPFEILERLVLIRAHDVGHVRFRVDVADLAAWVLRLDVVPDRLDQMRLAEPDAAVDEERVVRRRMLGDLNGGGTRKLVRASRHERIEGEGGIEPYDIGLAGRYDTRRRMGRFGGRG